jgi:hypothetical protein
METQKHDKFFNLSSPEGATGSEDNQASPVITVEGQEDVDIPYPFPFPSHYQSDIEVCLRMQVMSPVFCKVPY